MTFEKRGWYIILDRDALSTEVEWFYAGEHTSRNLRVISGPYGESEEAEQVLDEMETRVDFTEVLLRIFRVTIDDMLAELDAYAREVDNYELGLPMSVDHIAAMAIIIERYTRAAVEAERERCARVSEQFRYDGSIIVPLEVMETRAAISEAIAAAIRGGK